MEAAQNQMRRDIDTKGAPQSPSNDPPAMHAEARRAHAQGRHARTEGDGAGDARASRSVLPRAQASAALGYSDRGCDLDRSPVYPTGISTSGSSLSNERKDTHTTARSTTGTTPRSPLSSPHGRGPSSGKGLASSSSSSKPGLLRIWPSLPKLLLPQVESHGEDRMGAWDIEDAALSFAQFSLPAGFGPAAPSGPIRSRLVEDGTLKDEPQQQQRAAPQQQRNNNANPASSPGSGWSRSSMERQIFKAGSPNNNGVRARASYQVFGVIFSV